MSIVMADVAVVDTGKYSLLIFMDDKMEKFPRKLPNPIWEPFLKE